MVLETPQRIARLTPLDEVLVRIETLVAPVAPRRVEAAAALGSTLAEDVVFDVAVPPAALALRDGWAVTSELTTDAGAYAPAPLPAAVRIDVGAPLPAGADAVAPIDAVTVCDGRAQALAPVAPGEGVLPAGADVALGATLLAAGRRIGPLQLALLAAAGVAHVHIREPRLVLVRARPDAIIDAAVACIGDAVASQGGVVHAPGAALEQALTDKGFDAVIVVGGTGSGTNDATMRTLASVGEVLAHGVGLLPGETSGFGMVGARPVLALPGRLDAALATWHMLGRAVLARLTQCREPPYLRKAKLSHKLVSSVGLAELVPVRCENDAARPIASGYVPFAALALANGWVFVKAESEGYPAGSEVVIRPWP